MPCDESHADVIGEGGARCFIVEIGSAWLDRVVASGLPAGRLCFAGQTGQLSGALIRLHRECRTGDDASHSIIDGLLLEALGQARRIGAQEPRSPQAWIRPIRDVLHARFRERITIVELAAEAGVHPVHLCREFRRHNGLTIGAYLRQLRINYACFELAGARRSLTEIALDAGFSSHAHFTSTFHSMIGLSPAAFRSRAGTR